MKISHFARQKRNAPYAIIKKEIKNGRKISNELAEKIIKRKSEKSTNKDIFIIRRDLLGLYLLSKNKDKSICITYFNLNTAKEQERIKEYFAEKDIKRFNFDNLLEQDISISKAIILNNTINEVKKIKYKSFLESQRFKYVEDFPCIFYIFITLEGRKEIFRISKNKETKNVKVTMVT